MKRRCKPELTIDATNTSPQQATVLLLEYLEKQRHYRDQCSGVCNATSPHIHWSLALTTGRRSLTFRKLSPTLQIAVIRLHLS